MSLKRIAKNFIDAFERFVYGLTELDWLFIIIFTFLILFLLSYFVVFIKRTINIMRGYSIVYLRYQEFENTNIFDRWIQKKQFQYYLDYLQQSLKAHTKDNNNKINRIQSNLNKSVNGLKERLLDNNKTLEYQRLQLQQITSAYQVISNSFQNLTNEIEKKDDEIKKYRQGFARSQESLLIDKIILNIHAIQLNDQLDYNQKEIIIGQYETLLGTYHVYRISIKENSEFDKSTMKVVKTIETTDMLLNNKIKNVELYGYKVLEGENHYIVEYPQVVIYKISTYNNRQTSYSKMVEVDTSQKMNNEQPDFGGKSND